MKIQTFSVVVGGNACQATCPYCVSKMTGYSTCSGKIEDINERNFHKACQFAKMSGVSTVLLTVKGEPLLYPDHIAKYLHLLKKYEFPFIELQTNGIELLKHSSSYLKRLYDLGLTIVSLSCAHWANPKNQEIFGKKYKCLQEYILLLHRNNFSVRVSCVMLKNMIGDIARVKEFARICQSWGVEQFTVRPVSNDVKIDDHDIFQDTDKYKVYNWIKDREIDYKKRQEIEDFFNYEKNTTLLLELAHGAKVYDYNGQNISLNTCLTSSSDPNDIRQLIYYPNGRLCYSWTHKGAIII